MKRCPECRRDYFDATLLYCLDDGNALLEGPASADEPATAILHDTEIRAEAATSAQMQMTDETAVLPTATGEIAPGARGFDKKLLAAPILLSLIVVAGFLGYRYFKPATTEQINSIAVLPFENRSGNADTDYLSDGLADSLIYRLSQLPDLKVSPTSSVMRYKGLVTDVAQIAKELEVDAVMSGRLTQRGDDLSISVQLIDSRTKKLIWAEQYDRKMADLLATQREIATAITQKLQLKLSGNETGLTKKYTSNNEAYQLYLRGRFHFAKRTKEDLLKSIDFFDQAIKLDPSFALAFAALAESYWVMPSHTYMSPREATQKARSAVMAALALDPSLAEPHLVLGSILSGYDWEWTEAEREFKRALELSPENFAAHARYAQHLWAVGRYDYAIRACSKAIELEPLVLNSSANLSIVYTSSGQRDKGLELARKTYDLDPQFVTGRLALGIALNSNGLYDDAIRLSESLLATDPTNQAMLMIGGYAYAMSGAKNEAEDFIKRFKEIGKKQYASAYYVATIHAALGEKDKAFAELENSFEQRDWWLARMRSDPLMASLRSDPRFKAMLKRMNLPE